ncbi:MAG: sigma 54-interacting transcriptional regulator [Fibrobacterota bacterium]
MAKIAKTRSVLFVTSDQDLIDQIRENTCMQDVTIRIAGDHVEALTFLEKSTVDLVFIDIQTVSAQEMDLVNYIKTRMPETEVVILTSVSELDDATYALRNGASFYLIKPIDCSDLKSVIDKVAGRLERSREQEELEQRFLHDLMGSNAVMTKTLKLAMKIAPTNSTVLIGGETGTGKEFFARIIHRMSKRYEGEFVAMNCGAIPETLFESELFGHRKGAFTGADRDKPGLVEQAHMGTLFLDEVGELSPQAQVKLLRFLQEHSFRRVGDTTTRTVNVRIIAATNRHLPTLIEEGRFREDLYYRLNIFYLHLPPLRERKETIPNLVRLFVHRFNNTLGKNITRISKSAEVILANYDYPGNVRELENIIEHAMVLAEGNEITEKDLPEFMYRNRLLLTAPTPAKSVEEIITLEEAEKRHIEMALALLDHNYTETAKKLGVSRSTLWRKIKTYGLEQ